VRTALVRLLGLAAPPPGLVTFNARLLVDGSSLIAVTGPFKETVDLLSDARLGELGLLRLDVARPWFDPERIEIVLPTLDDPLAESARLELESAYPRSPVDAGYVAGRYPLEAIIALGAAPTAEAVSSPSRRLVALASLVSWPDTPPGQFELDALRSIAEGTPAHWLEGWNFSALVGLLRAIKTDARFRTRRESRPG
jgi:hypothetical protein